MFISGRPVNSNVRQVDGEKIFIPNVRRSLIEQMKQLAETFQNLKKSNLPKFPRRKAQANRKFKKIRKRNQTAGQVAMMTIFKKIVHK